MKNPEKRSLKVEQKELEDKLKKLKETEAGRMLINPGKDFSDMEEVSKEEAHEHYIKSQIKSILIESIIDYDKKIKALIPDKSAKQVDELAQLSIRELSDWQDVRIAYLMHLMDGDTVN